MSGPVLTFAVNRDRYLIVKVNDRPELVIAIDPLETDRPVASGEGIFNIMKSPYKNLLGAHYATTAFQRALDDASTWGTNRGSGAQGVVYVPAGVWTVGTLFLQSNTAVYLEPGAVLRFTGDASHYQIHGYKDSQARNLAWLITTRFNSRNISLYGRGIIDGNGRASLKVNNLAVNLLAPVYTTHFRVDGLTFRESSSWSIIPYRSTDVSFSNVKIFNALDMGENDGIDVMESQNVHIQNAIGISLDDPFSSKTWGKNIDFFSDVSGEPLPTDKVTFENLVAWTHCYAVKIGQGVVQPQNDVAFRNVTVYDAAVGIGVDHKYGTATASNIDFENIDIEHLSHSNDGNRTWMVLQVSNESGPNPIDGVTIKNVRVMDAGTSPARINGLSGSPISGVTLNSIVMPGAHTSASSLLAMHIESDTCHDAIRIVH